MTKLSIAAALAATLALGGVTTPVAAQEAVFRAACKGEVLTTEQVVSRGLQAHFSGFRAQVKGFHCYVVKQDDRARLAVLLQSDVGLKTWHDACLTGGGEIL